MTYRQEILMKREALKRIAPGAVKTVRFRFEAIGGGVAWIKTPKVHARHALQELIPGAKVRLGFYDDGSVTISGPVLLDRDESGHPIGPASEDIATSPPTTVVRRAS